MIFKVIEFFGAMLSLAISVGDISQNEQPTLKAIIAMAAAVVFTAAFVWQEARYLRVRKNKNLSNAKFFRYMASEIGKSGNSKVIVVSDGLSWARDEQVRKVLCAKGDRLTVLMRERNQYSDMLAANGVKILEYGGQAEPPASRFTYVDREGKSLVLVGWPKAERHEVWRYEVGDHPFVNSAKDVIDFLKQCAQRRQAAAAAEVS